MEDLEGSARERPSRIGCWQKDLEIHSRLSVSQTFQYPVDIVLHREPENQESKIQRLEQELQKWCTKGSKCILPGATKHCVGRFPILFFTSTSYSSYLFLSILHICVPTTFLPVIACASFLPETHGFSILGAARWQAEMAVTMMSPWLLEVKEIALLRARDARLAEQLRYQSCLNQAVLQAWYPVVGLQH